MKQLGDMKQLGADMSPPCWQVNDCPMQKKERCPAWDFNTGHLCWFISGTICQGKVHRNWNEKMKFCRKCRVFEPVKSLLEIWTSDEAVEIAKQPHVT